ncbi:RNA m5u methyltransferase family protein [Fructobacillus pseudoficulneus]|uniref:RNA m5u methyltransferase family protein n=1 Tax=Fructobacillus pseudoficulneus TaxID=220714 RepID=A0A3F3HAW9_9LACO|nr:23S rRNA (uracil(1939)-C(5))-methyltransferase RlmD [Fructobacillus pseudoficulneus]GAP03193.1 RNA m5u methyltransferase family protein [Fructobacillus pseudoficulneus]SEH42568.1 23S rRNA m(5)U-1939 methyltransferase [Fructobacillus pseudoficulneus]
MSERQKNTQTSHNNQGRRPYRKPSRANQPVEVKIGQKFPLTIKRLGINGEGIGYFKRKIVFIPGALPNEVVTAKVTDFTEKYIEAKVVTIREASPERVTPTDPAADLVGGFELAHLAYPAQLAFKKDLTQQALEKFQPQGYANYDIRDTIGMSQPDHYRNKASLPIRKIKGEVKLGLYKRGSHDLVDLPTIATQDEASMTIVRAVGKILAEASVSFYNEVKNSGLVKTVIVRANQAGQAQLVLVTNQEEFPGKEAIITALTEQIPAITGIFQNINPGKSSLIWGDETIKLWGDDYLQEEILGLTFSLSPRAFLQLNYEQMTKTYETAIQALNLNKNDRLVDAYSGVGTLGLSMAFLVQEVRGMEIIPEAVVDAKKNAQDNGIENAHYEVGSAEKVFPKWAKDGFKPTALVVDPPRPGLDPAFKKAVLRAKPEKFVYISCNPSTLARDLADLSSAYRVDFIQPIDMFPQTPRWEGVVKLSLKK